MPWTSNGGVRLYWEEEGRGEPLLLITGLSFSLAIWGELRPFLAAHFRTILFDNRCVGQSSAPLTPFRIASMAKDAVSIVDAARIEAAHVFGISMRGMIAQELALRSLERVSSLILGCTHAGFVRCILAHPRVLRLLADSWMSVETRMEAMAQFIYHPNTPRERIQGDLEIIRENAPALRGYLQQLTAIVLWSSWRRLPRIDRRTLVIHGDSDLLVPTPNARILADRIPNARLVILPEAGHMFPTDQPAPVTRRSDGLPEPGRFGCITEV